MVFEMNSVKLLFTFKGGWGLKMVGLDVGCGGNKVSPCFIGVDR